MGIFQLILGCPPLKLKHGIFRERKEGKQLCKLSRQNGLRSRKISLGKAWNATHQVALNLRVYLKGMGLGFPGPQPHVAGPGSGNV